MSTTARAAVFDAVAIRLPNGRQVVWTLDRKIGDAPRVERRLDQVHARGGVVSRGASHVATEVADEHARRDARIHARCP